MLNRLSPATVRAVPAQYQGIYAHGVEALTPNRVVFLSGQIGVATDGTTLGTFKDQAHQSMENVEALLASVGMTTKSIARVVYYVTDAKYLPELSEVRQARWNTSAAPSVTTLVVAALAAPDLMVEIEVTAVA